MSEDEIFEYIFIADDDTLVDIMKVIFSELIDRGYTPESIKEELRD